ncbi:hypothetical protein DAPPUDRAFT_330431 [Daphnia pulex]|uniref:Uncharacterized protein n=1 Tax=Daphnia pulex TaxID=6669 RepID=E9HJJ9_DAPPU|nr:hypothetical protein DAPPUDRAFT_330431 [Daphnia pulex]|eukprot:EFX68107.1 hypothetical protein DAPPUDRAFT_330431 [Daphnia pulex]
MSNPKFNRTGDPELEYLSKFTVSGLWTLCYTNRLLLLLGLVVYVSVFTAEIGSKSYSFHLVVIGFLAGEVAGTSAIFPVHLLAPKSNCQKGNAPENDFSSSADASRFELHGSPGHLLANVPPPPPLSQMNHHHHPMTNPITPACLPYYHPSESLF